MTAIQSSQDFVKALKSVTDPPFQEGPCKIEIARQVLDQASFYVPSKAEVITEWILTKFLKDKGKDRFVFFFFLKRDLRCMSRQRIKPCP